MEERKNLSIVVPVYNEEEALPIFLPHLIEVLEKIKADQKILYEIILIDDGSVDGTYKIMKEFAQKHRFFKIIHFGKNYNKGKIEWPDRLINNWRIENYFADKAGRIP